MNDLAPLTLYIREGCHLCEDTERLLRRLRLPATRVDIDSDPDLLARYSDSVPVVTVDGRIVLWGAIRESDLRRALAAYLR